LIINVVIRGRFSFNFAQVFNIQSYAKYGFGEKEVHNGLFRRKVIADVMIFAILFSFTAYISMTGFSTSFRRNFSGIVYGDPGVSVSGAIVMASGPEGYGFATTNSLGQYSINEGLKTGTYTVSVIKEGYLNAKMENVAVTVGQETPNINFYLSLSGGISGRVTDAVSELPLQNIIIVASTTGGETFGWSAVTDANGNYRIITNLATGTYNVTAVFPEGHIMNTISGIAVTAGVEVTGVNLVLERSGIISGRVTATPTGTPLGNATVYAASEDGGYVGFAQTNATGYYRISSGLGTGTYTVTAIYGMSFGGPVTGVNVVAGSEISNINIAIPVSPPPPSGMISGKVTDISVQPIPNALVTAQGPAGFGEAHADQNGNYIISSGLGTGAYMVTASAPGYSSQSVSGVSVTVGEVTPNVNFQLSRIPPAQSGRVSGTVQGDENPIPEFQYPIAILLVVTLVAAVVAKRFNVKARRL